MRARDLALAAALAAGMSGVVLAQGPPDGYRVRIGGAIPEADPLAPADAGVGDEAESDGEDDDAADEPDAPSADPMEFDPVDTTDPAIPAPRPTSVTGGAPSESDDAANPALRASPATRAERAPKSRKARRARRSKPRATRWARGEAVTPLEAARTVGRTHGAIIEFAQPLAFRHDSVSLAAGADAALDEAVDYLQASPEIRLVLVEGHTDATGSLRYNQALSEARAVAVRKALIAAGVAPERLVAYGYGETRPATPEQAPNRRVVFRIIEGDRKVLTRRAATEWGQIALVDARGAVEAAPSPETDGDGADMAPPAEAMRKAPASAVPVEAPAVGAEATLPDGAMALFIAPPTDGAGAPVDAAAEDVGPIVAPAGELTWRPLPVRGQLGEGHDIRTASASHALLRLPDLGRLWLGPETRIRLSKLHHDRADGKTYVALRIREGTVRAMLNPLERGISRSLIALPGGGLESTAADFELRIDADGRGTLRVDRGRVEQTGGARTRSIFAGQVIRLGAADAEPSAQLPPPTALGPLQGSFRRAPTLTWHPVPDAAGYRLEIAADVDFDRPEIRARTTAPGFDPRILAPGRPWYWRVRAIDRDGFDGSPSRIHQFRLLDVVEAGPAAAGLEPTR